MNFLSVLYSIPGPSSGPLVQNPTLAYFGCADPIDRLDSTSCFVVRIVFLEMPTGQAKFAVAWPVTALIPVGHDPKHPVHSNTSGGDGLELKL